MIPQIAQHPRNLSQQFGGPGFATPPFDSFQAPRIISDRFRPLPFRSQRDFPSSSLLASNDRPYAVESHGSQRIGLAASSASQGVGGRYHDPSEHMLRRKTPNGTLAAGYDGTPVQWSSKPPAMKHVLLPLSSVSSGLQGPASTAIPSEILSHQRSNSLGSTFQQTKRFNGDGRHHMSMDPGNWTYLPSNAQNVLNHLSMPQLTTYYPNNGMQVPTALQPPYQPSLGPTASNDGGFYGPYWPDGKFVPYRPAAYREPEHQHNYDFRFQEPSTSSMELMIPLRQHSYNIDSSKHVGRPYFPNSETGSRRHNGGYMPAPHPCQPHDNAMAYSLVPDGSRTPSAQTSHRASNAHFKEKTLSWAHSIYVDLLSFLHQSKKEHRQGRQPHGSKTYSKNNIYPKPPRQPMTAVGNSEWSHIYNSTSRHGAIGSSNHAGDMLPHSQSSTTTGVLGGWPNNGDSVEAKYNRFANPDAAHYIPPFHTAYQSSSSPLGKAREALEILTTLCEQSGWAWIDGMLLGGCLAYGLEEYHKALEWYSKIIALDPKLVPPSQLTSPS